MASTGSGQNNSTNIGNVYPVRSDWLFEVVTASQRFACEVSGEPPESLTRAASRVVERISAPITQLEHAILRSLLSRMALRTTEQVWGKHAPQRIQRSAQNLLVDDGHQPGDLFLRWSEDAARHFRRNPQHLARVAGQILKEGSYSVAVVSDRLYCSEQQLLRAFQRTFRISPREYRKRALVVRAFDLLRVSDLKNEAIAQECGLGCVKDLYRATRAVLGLTPHDIRQLDPADASRLRHGLQRSLDLTDGQH